MAWLRIDDGFTEHRKIVALKRADRWTWMELLTYCARQGNGGHVPAGITDVLRWITPQFLTQCVDIGLIDKAPDGTLSIHNWAVYNAQTVGEKVAHVLSQTPDATANEVYRKVGGKREIVLDEVAKQQERNPGIGINTSGNQIGNQLGTGSQSVPTGTQIGSPSRARALPAPTPSTSKSSSVVAREAIRQALDDDDLETAITHLRLGRDQQAIARETLSSEPGRLRAALEAALANGTKLAPYVDEILRNGSWPEPPGPPARSSSTGSTCPECGIVVMAPTTLADHMWNIHQLEPEPQVGDARPEPTLEGEPA